MFHKLVAAGIPNNPPRWPEVAAIVKKILRVYKDDAHDWERMGEWVERIGWPRFFELTELPFTKYQLDNWRAARGFDAIQNPVRGEAKSYSHAREINDFRRACTC
jgi:sulfite reductase beta subunit